MSIAKNHFRIHILNEHELVIVQRGAACLKETKKKASGDDEVLAEPGRTVGTDSLLGSLYRVLKKN